MDRFSEHLLERFVRQPEILSPHERQVMAQQLETDAVSSMTVDFYRAFYQEFDALAPGIPDRLTDFIESLLLPVLDPICKDSKHPIKHSC